MDAIVNSSVRDIFQTRAAIIRYIRRFFDDRGFLEVLLQIMDQQERQLPLLVSIERQHTQHECRCPIRAGCLCILTQNFSCRLGLPSTSEK